MNVRNLVTRLCSVPDITYQYTTNLVASSVTKTQASWHFVYRDIFKVSWCLSERKFYDKREVSQENSYTEIRKTYFLAPKLGVDLYTGSTYIRVNTVFFFFKKQWLYENFSVSTYTLVKFSVPPSRHSWVVTSINLSNMISFYFVNLVHCNISCKGDLCWETCSRKVHLCIDEQYTRNKLTAGKETREAVMMTPLAA